MSINSEFDKSSAGRVKYGRRVVDSIIELAIQEINGVASLSGKGFKVRSINGNIIDLDVFINVHFGSSCSEVAFRVQENIKSTVETMSSYKMGSININITGVEIQEKIANAL